MVRDVEVMFSQTRRVVWAKVVIHSEKGILDAIAIHPFRIVGVKEVGPVNHEFVAVKSLGEFNINRPRSAGIVHLQNGVPIPLTDELDRSCFSNIRERGGG